MFNLLSVAVLSSCFAIGGIAPKQVQGYQEQNQVVEEIKAPRQYVIYNDNSYSIQLSVNEVNTYTYENLYNYLDNNGPNSITFDLNGTAFIYSSDDGSYFNYVTANQAHNIAFVYDSEEYNNNQGTEANNYQLIYDDTDDPFEDVVNINTTSVDYNDLKSAIELDIEANTMPSISGIFQEVTSAVTAFIGSLGTAFTSVTQLFYADGNWTFLGVLILIGVATGLVYGAYRLIKGLLHRV